METIPHRELRNSSSAILKRVAAGESVAISNHGDVVGMLVPVPDSPIAQARVRGESVRPPSRPGFSGICRVSGPATAEILNDLRGDR